MTKRRFRITEHLSGTAMYRNPATSSFVRTLRMQRSMPEQESLLRTSIPVWMQLIPC